MNLRWAAFVACVIAMSIPLMAQSDWLPPEVESGLAHQLAERLTTIEPELKSNQAALNDGARNIVRGISTRLTTWGEKRVLARAPQFPALSLPGTMKPHLNAMGRYQVCNWATMRQQGEEYDDKSRKAGAVSTTGITLAIFYLRKPFTQGGGAVAEIEAFLTGEAMDREFQRAMKTPELMTHIEEQCQPFVTELFSPAK